MSYLVRIFRYGIQSFWRNIWLSLITILIVALNLFLTTSIFGLNLLGQQTLSAVKEKISLSVYFTPTTTDDRAEVIGTDLRKLKDVKEIRVVTRQQHLEDFKASKQSGDVALQALEELGENPFGPGLVITATSLDAYGDIAKEIAAGPYASAIEETGRDYETNQEVINKLSRYLKGVQTATIWLTLLFAVIAILMVFNAVRVAIYSQREEIGIMKLVGASDAFVRGPFFVTSLLYGIGAAVLTTAIILPIIAVSQPALDQFFVGYDVDVAGTVLSNIWIVFGVEALAGSVLAIISSMAAMGRYLRV